MGERVRGEPIGVGMSAGRKPALTIAQRADVATAIKRRRELRKRLDSLKQQIRDLKREHAEQLALYQAEPSLADLERKYGIHTQSLVRCVDRPFKTVNVLDQRAAEAQA